MLKLFAAPLLLGLALAAPAVAGEAQDRLFAVGVLDAVPTGGRLIFTHERAGDFDVARLPKIEHGAIELAVVADANGGREAEVTLASDGRERAIRGLPAGAGHPLLLFFLETTARNVATLTGGSPFYIRNRMREALGAQDVTAPVVLEGSDAPGELLTFRPFANDRHRDRLGALAGLEIRVTLSDAVPGGFARLEAVAGPDGAPALAESIVFVREER